MGLDPNKLIWPIPSPDHVGSEEIGKKEFDGPFVRRNRWKVRIGGFVNFGDKEASYCLPLLEQLRNEGISSELYPDGAKLKKQLKYADQKQIPAVIMVGEDEMQSGNLSFKNMISGEQEKLTVEAILKKLKAEVKN